MKLFENGYLCLATKPLVLLIGSTTTHCGRVVLHVADTQTQTKYFNLCCTCTMRECTCAVLTSVNSEWWTHADEDYQIIMHSLRANISEVVQKGERLVRKRLSQLTMSI